MGRALLYMSQVGHSHPEIYLDICSKEMITKIDLALPTR